MAKTNLQQQREAWLNRATGLIRAHWARLGGQFIHQPRHLSENGFRTHSRPPIVSTRLYRPTECEGCNNYGCNIAPQPDAGTAK